MEAPGGGVLAFAITLLVLKPTLRPPGSQLHQFLRDREIAWEAPGVSDVVNRLLIAE